ncbi:hypothetical protein ACH35V_29705 [Actinomadura sp. 1N219]|uniref:hypothetical protein n=1 Tax=Actinomadura sp. 1N219 TaxID=3375152 RepID=UPI00378B0508
MQMFAGYAGSSESGFRAEVESEQDFARGEHLIELADTPRPNRLGRARAYEAVRRLEAICLQTDGFARRGHHR